MSTRGRRRSAVAMAAALIGGVVGILGGNLPGFADHTCMQIETISPPSTILIVPDDDTTTCNVTHSDDCTSTSPDGIRITVCDGTSSAPDRDVSRS